MSRSIEAPRQPSIGLETDQPGVADIEILRELVGKRYQLNDAITLFWLGSETTVVVDEPHEGLSGGARVLDRDKVPDISIEFEIDGIYHQWPTRVADEANLRPDVRDRSCVRLGLLREAGDESSEAKSIFIDADTVRQATLQGIW